MTDQNSPATGENIPVRRARVGSVVLYDVREHELGLLEEGGAATSQLNFAIFLYSIAFTSFVALLTSDFKSDTAKTIFIVATFVGAILGTYFIQAWRRSKKSVAKVVSEIRNRLNGNSSYEPDPEDVENQPQDI